MYKILKLLEEKRWLRRTIEMALFAAVFFGLRAYMQGELVQGQAPDFQRVTILGEEVRFSDYRGKPLLVQFWATWCPICEREQSSIQSIAADYPVLTVAMQSGDAKDILPYLEKRQLTFPVIADADGSLSKQFGVAAVPASFVLDADGTVRFVEVGFTTEMGMRLRLWLAGL